MPKNDSTDQSPHKTNSPTTNRSPVRRPLSRRVITSLVVVGVLLSIGGYWASQSVLPSSPPKPEPTSPAATSDPLTTTYAAESERCDLIDWELATTILDTETAPLVGRISGTFDVNNHSIVSQCWLTAPDGSDLVYVEANMWSTDEAAADRYNTYVNGMSVGEGEGFTTPLDGWETGTLMVKGLAASAAFLDDNLALFVVGHLDSDAWSNLSDVGDAFEEMAVALAAEAQQAHRQR